MTDLVCALLITISIGTLAWYCDQKLDNGNRSMYYNLSYMAGFGSALIISIGVFYKW